MKENLKYIYVLLIITTSLLGQNMTQDVSKVGTSAAPFLEIPVGATAVGMGGAFVSTANDATALYWNAAGITSLQQNEVVAMHSNWIADISFDFAALVLSLENFGYFGLSITSLSMDDMKVRTIEKPEGTGEFFNAADIAVGLSYARKLSDRFALGATVKYIEQSIWHMKATAVAIDLGTTFRTDLFNGIIIGASVSNFGTSMQLDGRDTRSFGSVDETKLGSNQRIPQNIELDTWDLPLLFQIGVSTIPFETEDYSWTAALDARHPSDNRESINIGTELSFRDYLFLRGGYHSLFLDKAEGGLTFGIGFATRVLFSDALIKFDYAFRDMGRLENAQLFSIAINF